MSGPIESEAPDGTLDKGLEYEGESPTRSADGEPSEDTPAQRAPEPDIVETRQFSFRGHVVEIRASAGNESLSVDGIPWLYEVSSDGYVLHSAAYAAPQPTLLDAARIALGENGSKAILVGHRLEELDNAPDDAGVISEPRVWCGRVDFMSLGNGARTRLAIALNKLYAKGIVKAFADEHAANWFRIHYGPAFLPWHRHFLLRFENHLRREDPQLRLPYWDWTRADSRDLEVEPWKSFFGGRDNNGGKFDAWGYTRDQQPGGSLPSVNAISQALQRGSFVSFRAIEGGHHSGPHMWVGGTMNTAGSPADPLFYLHHVNVDRLWAIWQRNHTGVAQYTLDEASTDRSGYEGSRVPLNSVMAGGATPRSMIDHTALGVPYASKDAPLETLVPGLVTADHTRRLVTSTAINFGRVIVGDIKVKTLSLRNTGTQTIRVEIDADQGQISWNTLEGFIQPCGVRELAIEFRPTATGTVQENLILETNAAGGQRTIEVTGIGRKGNVP